MLSPQPSQGPGRKKGEGFRLEGCPELERLSYKEGEWVSFSWPAGSLENWASVHQGCRAIPPVSSSGDNSEGGASWGPLCSGYAGVILDLLKAIAQQLTNSDTQSHICA